MTLLETAGYLLCPSIEGRGKREWVMAEIHSLPCSFPKNKVTRAVSYWESVD
jgi:hypothetical protein